jgi:ribosomal protein S18 acetylase RimI-like enzyme
MYPIELAQTEHDRHRLRALFREIAQEQGWQSGDWLECEQAGANYLGLKVDSEWVGGLQMVVPDGLGRLPYSAVWPDVQLEHPTATGHVTVLGLLPEYRGTPTFFWSLCIELWRMCQKAGIDAVVLEATPPMLARYRKLGWPLEEIGSLRMHWGEPCVLAQMEFDRVAVAMVKRAMRSPAYRTLVTQAVRSSRDIPCLVRPALA